MSTLARPVPAPGSSPPAPAPEPTVHAHEPGRLRRFAARHPRLGDALVALVVQAVGLSTAIHGHAGPWTWPADVALVVPLIWRRRAPVAVFAVLAGVALVQWGIGVRLGADAALLVALYTVAAYRPRRTALAAAAVVEIGVVLASVRFSPAQGLVPSLVFLTGLAAAAFFVGTSVRNRRAYLGALVDRAAWLERERDQQARLGATEERARIAREMHDVVAHSLTVVVTMAEAAAATTESDPAAARLAMRQVAGTGRTALGEMRRLLGVLRADEPGPGEEPPGTRAPVPGLDRIDELVTGARTAGLPVRLTVTGQARGLPSTLDATAYRVVQESLTNVLKHAADPVRVHVRLAWGPEDLRIDVTDDGRRRDRDGEPPRGGHGLSGMRERLSLFSGAVTSGPDPAGGWSVRAVLPLGPSR